MRGWNALLGTALVLVMGNPAWAVIDPQSDGSDGALNVTSADLTIDLSQAVTGTWNQAGTGTGVYDASKWAVVFKYSSVNIASGRTVRFTNHPSGAPVVWLVQGGATITGTVNLDGENGVVGNRTTVPGPGGFPGGRGLNPGSTGTAGYGPGGGRYINQSGWQGGSGSYATIGIAAAGVTYGNVRILPLIGGSGGAGATASVNCGGAGGGAILMVAGSRVELSGTIRAYGGLYSGGASGEGSGGAIRIVADTLSGSGSMAAVGWNNVGGNGRIRLETNVMQLTQQSQPAYSLLNPLGGEGVVIWPPEPVPTIRIATVNGVTAPTDPRGDNASLVTGDLTISATTAVPVTLEAANVPTNSTVTVRVVLGSGDALTIPATFQSGDATASQWAATLTSLSPNRVSALQAKVVLP